MSSYAALAATALALLFYNSSPAVNTNSAYVTDLRTNVSYVGLSNDGIDTFLNIPFGQDTSSAGRFAPPKPFIPPHNTTFNATVAGPACPQSHVTVATNTGLSSDVTNISEDCLNLRVTRPSSTTRKSKLPVMVFIYGGKSIFPSVAEFC